MARITNSARDSEERFKAWHERQQAINELCAYLRDEPYQYQPLRHGAVSGLPGGEYVHTDVIRIG